MLNQLFFPVFAGRFFIFLVTSVYVCVYIYMGLAGNTALIPGSERSPEEGNGSPLQYLCLENPMNRDEWL